MYIKASTREQDRLRNLSEAQVQPLGVWSLWGSVHADRTAVSKGRNAHTSDSTSLDKS